MNPKPLAMLVGRLISVLITLLPPKLLKKAVDALLDKVEEAVASSSTRLDDVVVLPLCVLIRQTFDIPDDLEDSEMDDR